MRYDAVIFDLDGTLLDTINYISECTNTVLARNSLPEHRVEQYKSFVGDGMTKLIERAVPERERTKNKIELFEREMKDIYHSRGPEKIKPFPGIVDMLETLSSKGIALAVLSNKLHRFTVEHIERIIPQIPFQEVRGAMESIPLKPSPEGAFAIAEKMGLDRARILFVGDMVADILTAANAGMASVGVLWGFSDRETLVKAGATFTIKSPGELIRLIDQ